MTASIDTVKLEIPFPYIDMLKYAENIETDSNGLINNPIVKNCGVSIKTFCKDKQINKVFIEFSVGRVLFGDNIYLVPDSSLNELHNKINSLFNKVNLDLKIHISEIKLVRFHICKDVELMKGYLANNLIKRYSIGLPRGNLEKIVRTYSESGGLQVVNGNKSSRYSLYNKSAEHFSKTNKKSDKEIIRFEVQLNKTKQIVNFLKDILGKSKGYYTLGDIYNVKIWEKIICKGWEKSYSLFDNGPAFLTNFKHEDAETETVKLYPTLLPSPEKAAFVALLIDKMDSGQTARELLNYYKYHTGKNIKRYLKMAEKVASVLYKHTYVLDFDAQIKNNTS